MKKLISLLLALCLMGLCAAACAEVVQAGAEPLKLEGFTLALDQGVSYKMGVKQANQVYITVYPNSLQGDTATNFNCAWNGGTFSITAEQLKVEMETIKQSAINGLEAQGIRINSYDMSDPFEMEFAGEPCLAYDAVLNITTGGQDLSICRRQFYIGSTGFIFTVTAIDKDEIERVTELMTGIITWD